MRWKLTFSMAALITVGALLLLSSNDEEAGLAHPADDWRGNGSHDGCSHDHSHSGILKSLERRTQERLFTEPVVGQSRAKLVESVSYESDWKGQSGAAIRAREVAISPIFLNKTPFSKGEVLTLNLFDDTTIDTVVFESFLNVNGTVSTTARVANTKFGRAVLAFTGNELRVKVVLPESNEIYAVHFNQQDGQHYALELDPSIAAADACGTIEGSVYANPPQAEAQEAGDPQKTSIQPLVASDEGVALVVIDTMVVYAENVVTSAGSEANVQNIAAQGIALSNDVHSTTNTGMYINLIHTARLTGYTDTGNKNTDLNRVTALSDGHIDEVHTWRDTYGADFVQMMHSVGGGLGWRPNFASNTSGRPDIAFSIVGWGDFASYTPAHEMGHNMNLSHAKYQSYNVGTPTAPTGTDAAGWHWHPGGDTGVDGYNSVMSYNSYPGETAHTTVGLFSDPNIIDNGQAAGHIVHANCARVLRLYKNIYAAYRTRPLSANSILVESPNGGEILSRGETVEFRWNSHAVAGNIRIELYKGESLEREVTAGTINDRIFYYTIPSDLQSSKLYKLRISSVNDQGIEDYSDVDFTITQSIYSTNLDSNPNFSVTGQWEYGIPGGDNPIYAGAGAAYTGTHIYDTNLLGVSGSTGYLTTQAIDCSDYEEVNLKFAGWFSVFTGYDANVEVSNNGATWTQLSSVTNTTAFSWKKYSYDISAVADGEPTVYVRWVHFKDSGTSNYSGMSVDDVSITGVVAPTLYQIWSGGFPTSADSNGDGISNGIAWVLGAASPSVNAVALRPVFDHATDPTYSIFTYRRSDLANNDSSTIIGVEYGSDLGVWWTAVHDNEDIVITETNDHYGSGIDRVEVKIKRTLATDGKIFARLLVQMNN